MNILELYSGIGGMHMALNESGINGKIVAAVEINTIANSVYSHNFPDTLLLNKNIQGLTAQFLNKLNIDAIFMSPPCQPFTRNGLKRDELDNRACSFSHILQILPKLKIKYILIENVKGFESSIMRNKLVDTLKQCNFTFQEYILTPTQIGVSNTRHRYYCIAKKDPLKFNFFHNIVDTFPERYLENDLFPIVNIIEENINEDEYFLSEKILLKHVMLLDICYSNSKRSCCFTKSYGKYMEGTGSVYTSKSKEIIEEIYSQLKSLPCDDKKYVEYAKALELRFFTPKEVCRLMSFPESFMFPNELTNNQKYKLLGNSINVKVVSKLIQMLVDN